MKTPLDFFLPQPKALKGGKGSGNHGHGGLPGVHGGSSPSRGKIATNRNRKALLDDVGELLRKYETGETSEDETVYRLTERYGKFVKKHTPVGENLLEKYPDIKHFHNLTKNETETEHGWIGFSGRDVFVKLKNTGVHALELDQREADMLADSEDAILIHNHPLSEDGTMGGPLSFQDIYSASGLNYNTIVSISRDDSGRNFLSVMTNIYRYSGTELSFIDGIEFDVFRASYANETLKNINLSTSNMFDGKHRKVVNAILPGISSVCLMRLASANGFTYYEVDIP